MFRRCLTLGAVLALTGCTPTLEALAAWVHEWETAAAEEGWPCPAYADDLAWRGLPQHFLFVIERESRCDPAAVNEDSGALGLTQIMPSWLDDLCAAGIACSREDLLDPARNLDAAAVIFAQQGPDAWSQTWTG